MQNGDTKDIPVSVLEEFETENGLIGIREVCSYMTNLSRFDWVESSDQRIKTYFSRLEYPQPRDPQKQLRYHSPSVLMLLPASSSLSTNNNSDDYKTEDTVRDEVDGETTENLPKPLSNLDLVDGRRRGFTYRFLHQKDEIVVMEGNSGQG